MSTTIPAIYAAINAVMADISKEGIGKDRTNEAQKYKFRGIDDVYNALAPILSRHKLIILPRVLSREVTERVSIKEYQGQKKESVLFYVAVEVEFDLIAGEDGSKHTIKTYGEAMDSGDKATNKAMSAAYKYAAMQAFCIPTEGDNDADGHTHEIVPAAARLTAENRAKIDGVFDKADTIDAANKGLAHYREKLPAEFHGELLEIFDAAVKRINRPAPQQFDEVA